MKNKIIIIVMIVINIIGLFWGLYIFFFERPDFIYDPITAEKPNYIIETQTPMITFKQDDCYYLFHGTGNYGIGFSSDEERDNFMKRDEPQHPDDICIPNTIEIPLQTAVQMIVDYEKLKYVAEKTDTKIEPAYITK